MPIFSSDNNHFSELYDDGNESFTEETSYDTTCEAMITTGSSELDNEDDFIVNSFYGDINNVIINELDFYENFDFGMIPLENHKKKKDCMAQLKALSYYQDFECYKHKNLMLEELLTFDKSKLRHVTHYKKWFWSWFGY